MTFNNNRRFTRQTFDILSSSLKIDRKGLLDRIEYEIPFDNIHNKKKIQTQINNNLVITGLFFFVFSFLFLLGTAEELTVIFLSIGVIFVLTAFMNRKKTVTIATYTGDEITLYFNNKNKEDVVEFSDKIIEASNNYLMKKYGKIDRALPVEQQIDNLQFLRNREIITENHYEALKDELLGREGKSAIGFGQ
ncbi:hypothetical protein DC498_19340 [Terrimonas sp.]|uniref:hypothetical protein n=1 Tax=Terrimonas sp. TaxID=1914338 RepID=UPI000D524BEC|nr:hypothetical protein [Terrimonas sp.]PVD50582.1 hypothetical protein DC498_19340 [Terrimonas sp.]